MEKKIEIWSEPKLERLSIAKLTAKENEDRGHKPPKPCHGRNCHSH